MKVNKKAIKNIKRFHSLAIVVTLLIISLSIVFLLNNNLKNQGLTTPNIDIDSSSRADIDYRKPTDEQIEAGENIKNSTNDSDDIKNDLGLSFSSVTQNTDILQVRTVISGSVSNSGTCTLTLQKDDQLFEYIESTFALSSYSTCQGFDIDKTELGLGGWNLSLSVKIDDKTSSINKMITLE